MRITAIQFTILRVGGRSLKLVDEIAIIRVITSLVLVAPSSDKCVSSLISGFKGWFYKFKLTTDSVKITGTYKLKSAALRKNLVTDSNGGAKLLTGSRKIEILSSGS